MESESEKIRARSCTWCGSMAGREGEELVNHVIKNWAEDLEEAPDESEVKLTLVKVGKKCIRYENIEGGE